MTQPTYDLIPGTARDSLADLAVTSKAQAVAIDSNFARTNTFLNDYRATTSISAKMNTNTNPGNWLSVGANEVPWGAWWPPATMTLPANPRQLVLTVNASMAVDPNAYLIVHAIVTGTGLTIPKWSTAVQLWGNGSWQAMGAYAMLPSNYLIGGGQVTLTPSYTVTMQNCYCHGGITNLLAVC